MRILVLTETYPSKDRPYAMSYVHSRCLALQSQGFRLTVGSFSTRQAYNHEGVTVSHPREINNCDFDVVFSHAPNLKNHLPHLLAMRDKKIVLIIHGHEVLHRFRDYPPPYSWDRPTKSKTFAVNAYDQLKLSTIRMFLSAASKRNKVGIVFVSEWMLHQFAKNVGSDTVAKHAHTIIPNPVNDAFVRSCFAPLSVPIADFVTIRPLDHPKYAIDLVVRSALINKERTYHIYGKGRYFEHNPVPPNITLIPCFINQSDIKGVLGQYRCALMPTRYDSQGVMSCEIATYGMPMITTDLPICREMLGGFGNVRFNSERQFSERISIPLPARTDDHLTRFAASSLVSREIEFANDL